MQSLYFLDGLGELLETVFYTGFLSGDVPISLMLVGPSGTAKSQILMRYHSSYITHSDSISSQGLFDLLANDRDNKLRFLVIPDFNPTISRRPATVQSTVANLLSMTADGTTRVDDGRKDKVVEHAPVALITACTPEIYQQHARRWFALGIRRRIIPIHFSYSASTEMQLQQLVQDSKIHSTRVDVIRLSTPKASQPIIPEKLAPQITLMSQMLAANLGKGAVVIDKKYKWYTVKVVPISPHVTLRALARAHAIRDKRTQVNDSDIHFLRTFLDFTDPEFPRNI